MWLAIRLFAMTGVLGGVLLSGTASLGDEKSLEVVPPQSRRRQPVGDHRSVSDRRHRRLVVLRHRSQQPREGRSISPRACGR